MVCSKAIDGCSSMHDSYNLPIHFLVVPKNIAGCKSQLAWYIVCFLHSGCTVSVSMTQYLEQKRTTVTKAGNVNTIKLARAMITSQS
jgi:hypothetical protein